MPVTRGVPRDHRGRTRRGINPDRKDVSRFVDHHAGTPKAYPALIQTGGPVTVIRDGTPNYEDTGYFGINIHGVA